MILCMFLLLTEPIAKKVEYFAALGTSKVKLFKGPGANYPLLYILTQRYYPIKVIGEFDHWCRVQCPDGETGWVRKCYLSTKYRRSILLEDAFLYSKNKTDSKIIAKIYKNVFVRIKKQNKDWSYIVVNNIIKGWIPTKYLW